MNLEEAIKHLEETLEDSTKIWGCENCKEEHKQLLTWLLELRSLRAQREAEENAPLTMDQRLIDAAPTITPESLARHGRWGKVYKSGVTVTDGYVSSCCDMWNERKSSYCPHCGAVMDLEK